MIPFSPFTAIWFLQVIFITYIHRADNHHLVPLLHHKGSVIGDLFNAEDAKMIRFEAG